MNKTLHFFAGLLAALILPLSSAHGGPLPTAASQRGSPPGLVLAFEELWEPRTAATGVFGVVATHVLKSTPDGSDPQQGWASNSIRGKWGTLRTLDGSVAGLPDVTGLGPNPSWMAREGKLFFHAGPVKAPGGEATDGFALISKATFPRSQPIVVEAALSITQGSETAFVGMALIAGEGDYRELALYRRAKGRATIDRVTPLRSSVLATSNTDVTTVRIEYDPADGFSYFVNGRLSGREAIGHEGANFAADPHVGLYFTGNPGLENAFAEGFVGPVRVWARAAPPVAGKTAGQN